MSTASDIEEQAAAWLVRREAPDFTVQEQEAFEAWLAADSRHRAAYVRLETAWRRADRLSRLRPLDGRVHEDLLARSPFVRIDIEEFPARAKTRGNGEWAVDADALAQEEGREPAEAGQASEPRRRSRVLMFAAAAAIALVAIAAGIWFAVTRTGWQEYATEYGGFERVLLDDGSVVHLNTNSVMRVHMTRELREVVLERGEALFKVAHDPTRPFDVQAAGTRVRAVGTEFSVRVHEAAEMPGGQKGVEVLVREGRVAIDPPPPKPNQPAALPRSVPTLSAGEAVTVTAKRVRVQKVAEADVSRKLSWVEGRLWFERQRLADVVAEFNRYNRRQMVIADPAIADLRIGGGFEATDPDSFIAALERTLGVRAFPASPDEGGPDVIRLVGTEETP
ncbi:MAG: FecR domain-containing protein [Steroidobacteraceae bacterium]|nr:FecR domain-containing protein [Steroidobacteraceae bacterium]